MKPSKIALAPGVAVTVTIVPGAYGPVGGSSVTKPGPVALALTVYDDEHSQAEERWATIGHAENGQVLVVIHTHEAFAANQARVRVISARAADRREIADYEDTPR